MESQQNLLDSRADIEFLPLQSEEDLDDLKNDDENENVSPLEMDEEAYDPTRNESLTPFQQMPEVKRRNAFKNRLSFALSVFNLMNVILGSGILGLAEVVENLGIFLFLFLIILTAVLAAYMINQLLHSSEVAGKKTYEELAQLSFGIRGKVIASVFIILHCLGAMVTYIYIVKNELPEVIKAFVDYKPVPGEDVPYYLTGDFVVVIVLLVIIAPLSSLKDIRFLGYSSAFGMACMLFFTITVIAKKFSIPCPLPLLYTKENHTEFSFSSTIEIEDNQTCEAAYFTINARSAYAVPTMLFSFMCHASMLPIYAELRKPSIKKMQKVANVSIANVLTLYICAALFGYLTFFNRVQSELLLSYSLYNSKDGLIIVARMMVIICVTLSVPLLHYPARKTIILTFLPRPLHFSWFRHIGIMIINLAITVMLVVFVPNIRDIFGMAGATSSGSLFLLFPSAFFIRITGKSSKSDVRTKYSGKRKVAWVILIVGTALLLTSMILIIADWLT